MDAKEPKKCNLTSFPILKGRKKQNLTSVKVSILEFHLGRRGITLKTRGPGPSEIAVPASTFDDR